MTLIYADPIFEKHQTGYHPECPERLQRSSHFLTSLPWFTSLSRGRISRAADEMIMRTHSPAVVKQARELAAAGGGALDADTFLSSASYEVALFAAGTAMAAVEQVVQGRAENAFCLMRPPGHHATADASMGFCIFNNIAIAAHYARDVCGLQRILIVDFDVHHGNGTQDIFYADDSVHFYSIHRYPFYPGSGAADESGRGAGLGATLNVPVAFGSSRALYLDLFRQGLERALARCRPELILISAGFDAHRADPIGSLGLEVEDFEAMTRLLVAAARSYCQGRIVSCLEGGYNLELLPQLISAHIEALTSPLPHC